MKKIAFVDLDGVLADSTARFAKAEEAKATYYDANRQPGASAATLERLIPALERGANDIYWRTAFTPELVKLDTLMDGVAEALEKIEQAGYLPFFLTSRPESMRQATVDWFWSFSPNVVVFSDEYRDQLIMKPTSQQYVKTVTWKAGVIQLLTTLFAAETVLVVDDESANHDELSKYAATFGMLYLAKSLDEAATLISK